MSKDKKSETYNLNTDYITSNNCSCNKICNCVEKLVSYKNYLEIKENYENTKNNLTEANILVKTLKEELSNLKYGNYHTLCKPELLSHNYYSNLERMLCHNSSTVHYNYLNFMNLIEENKKLRELNMYLKREIEVKENLITEQNNAHNNKMEALIKELNTAKNSILDNSKIINSLHCDIDKIKLSKSEIEAKNNKLKCKKKKLKSKVKSLKEKLNKCKDLLTNKRISQEEIDLILS